MSIQTRTASRPAGIDGGGGEHAPELYQPKQLIEPMASPEAITDNHIEQFHELGFLSINNLLTDASRISAMDALVQLIMNPPAEWGGLQFEASAIERLDQLDAEQRQSAVRKLMGYCDHAEPLAAIRDDSVLLSLVRRLIDGREPKCFQEMALLKGPGGREKPWHQDNAYFAIDLSETVVGVWIALDKATVENACMHVIPGSHRKGPMPHFQRRDWQICDTDVAVDQVVACPLEPGGALLFNGMLQHGTPVNRSNHRRRALQLHYVAADAKWTETEQRLAIWGSEGKDVEC